MKPKLNLEGIVIGHDKNTGLLVVSCRYELDDCTDYIGETLHTFRDTACFGLSINKTDEYIASNVTAAIGPNDNSLDYFEIYYVFNGVKPK